MDEQKTGGLSGGSGSIEPVWPPKTTVRGTITEDGSVVWVVA